MNYLSHYFLDSHPGKPYHNFGLVLPDMMGAAVRGWKPDFTTIAYDQQNHLHLVEGIQKHHLADKYFHSSAFFTAHTQAIRQLFEANNFAQPGTKLFFVAHIFLEFMLDRIIMQNHEELAKHFYADIDMVEESTLMPFLEQTKMEAGNFFNFLGSFRKHRYLYAYLEPESLFYSLNGTLQRAKQQPFSENLLQNYFPEVIQQTEELLKPVYQDFFSDIKQKSK